MRSPKKRSLQGVNEHFEGEYNAKNTLLDSFFFIYYTLSRILLTAGSFIMGSSTHAGSR